MQRSLLKNVCGGRIRTRFALAGTRSWLLPMVGMSLGELGCESSTGLAPESERLIQTDSPQYDLQPEWIGWRVDIPYVFINRTGGTVYLANCNGGFGLHLEREDSGSWHTAWSPVILLCLSPPIVIERNVTFTDTLHVWGVPPGSDAIPQFDVDDPSGTYRIVWDAAHWSSEQIPLVMRISNRFLLRR
jgi:hypothetical protein